MSGWADRLTLIAPGGWDTDQYGNQMQADPTRREIWANRWSLSAAYMLKAATENQRQARQYQVRTSEYQSEPDAEADGIHYKVSAVNRGEYTILTLTEVTGDG